MVIALAHSSECTITHFRGSACLFNTVDVEEIKTTLLTLLTVHPVVVSPCECVQVVDINQVVQTIPH